MKNEKIKKGINNFFPKNRKAAMEMSVGTIVTIVLLMTVLVLGLSLTTTIFDSSKKAIELSNVELQKELGKLFQSDEDRVKVYPSSGELELKVGKEGGFGIGIKNIAESASESPAFYYEVVHIDNGCGISPNTALKLIQLGGTGSVDIPIGETRTKRVNFKIPSGTPKCTFWYELVVTRNAPSSSAHSKGYATVQLTLKTKN